MTNAILHLHHRRQGIVVSGIVAVRDVARQMRLKVPRIKIGVVLVFLESLRAEIQAVQLRRAGRTNAGDK